VGFTHPILLQRLQLQFDASVPEFTLSEADHPVELYSALFQSMSDVDGRAIGRDAGKSWSKKAFIRWSTVPPPAF